MSPVETTTLLRKTPLNAVHRRLGAKMVEFGGWEMPVEYPAAIGCGIIPEHVAVRTGVGIFDVSHMGDIRLSGPGALAAVQHISMNDASRLSIGQAQYSALLYPQGTFVDDVIVHRLGEQDYLLVINAGTREKDFNWVQENTRQFDCAVENLSDEYTQIAIQGPKAVDLMRTLSQATVSIEGSGEASFSFRSISFPNVDAVKFYWFTHGHIDTTTGRGAQRSEFMVARTGYTGEDGFEIYIPGDEITSAAVWNAILQTGKQFGAVPCGLGARNTLRLEAKLPLYGHEISDTINVWEAGLDRFCKLEKPEFIGREALEQARAAGVRRTLIGLEMVERGIARDGYRILNKESHEIGYVTSGSPAPFLKKNIALGYVSTDFSGIGTEVLVEIRGQAVRAKVVSTPFYKRQKKS